MKKRNRPANRKNDFNQDQTELLLEGRNAVLEALKAERSIDKLLIQDSQLQGSIQQIIYEAKQQKIVIQRVNKQKLDSLSTAGNHQGVIAFVPSYDYVSIDFILQKAKDKGESPFVLILDEINDPHNLGAILRTANAAGVHGVIIPKRRAVGLTSTVAKVSAGAIEYVGVARVSNLVQAVEELKKQGLWIVGGDMNGEILYTMDLKGPIGIVIGNEGEGISHLLREKCDFIGKIPMYGEISSLNASVAGSLMMYEVVRQRYFRQA
ncbi:MAG: 23S rRNA (guanosine(2251)-2'-O)-methyltransferase RlmB [Epulopiscium sp.]|nr:23S rRNA (guanosine(2251)-2'-O)-methyltransferase RlmB [Candidatus Epulonipiscium sp.]